MATVGGKAARTRKPGLRRFWLATHLYLGLSLGLAIALAGLTGSLLVFYLELDEWLNPPLALPAVEGERLPYEALFQAIRQAEPERQRGWRLEIPEDAGRMLTARYYKPKETEQAQFAPLMLSIDPYSGAVVAKRFWGRFAMTWLYDLHYNLLLDFPGKLAMAAVGGLLLLSLGSGLYLWWPPRHKWRSALTFKRQAGAERLTYDLHKVAGVYGFVVISLLALTGVALEIPDYVNPVVAYFSPARVVLQPKSNLPPAGANRITLDSAVAAGRRLFPAARVCWIETPHGSTGVYRINFRQAFEPSLRFPKTNVWVDQYSAAVLAVDDPRNFGLGDTVLAWLHPLHSGEAFGLAGRLTVLFAGLLCPLLFATGVLRWWHKRRAKLKLMAKPV